MLSDECIHRLDWSDGQYIHKCATAIAKFFKDSCFLLSSSMPSSSKVNIVQNVLCSIIYLSVITAKEQWQQQQWAVGQVHAVFLTLLHSLKVTRRWLLNLFMITWDKEDVTGFLFFQDFGSSSFLCWGGSKLETGERSNQGVKWKYTAKDQHCNSGWLGVDDKLKGTKF